MCLGSDQCRSQASFEQQAVRALKLAVAVPPGWQTVLLTILVILHLALERGLRLDASAVGCKLMLSR